MNIIIIILSVSIGLATMFLIGSYFGQGVMVGHMMCSDEPGEAAVGKSWYDAFQWGLKYDDGLFNRLVAKIVFAGIEFCSKSNEERLR